MRENKVIMVVEDEETVREALCDLIANEGYDVISCHSGNNAIKGLQENEVDTIICDYHMEDGDGSVVLSKANELKIPVIMMTSVSQKNIIVNIMNLKPFHFFDKNESSENLLLKIKEAVVLRVDTVEAIMYRKLGEKSAQMIHDINNPLSIITGSIEILKNNPNKPEIIVQTLDRIDSSTKRISNLIKETKMHVKDEGIITYPEHSIVTFLNSVLAEQSVLMLKANSTISLKNLIGKDVMVRFNDNDLRRVFGNLIENSVYEFRNSVMRNPKRHIFIEIKMGHFKQIEIRYKDTGNGIPENVKNKLFQERITTKPAGIGSGLGLEGCAEIIESHLGSIRAGDCSDGAEFIISLPLSIENIKKLAA